MNPAPSSAAMMSYRRTSCTTTGTPDPANIATFDSLFRTHQGEMDIVPLISGTYEDLIRRARPLTVHGVADVSVTAVEGLLACFTVPRRTKHPIRVYVLRSIQRGDLDVGPQR